MLAVIVMHKDFHRCWIDAIGKFKNTYEQWNSRVILMYDHDILSLSWQHLWVYLVLFHLKTMLH